MLDDIDGTTSAVSNRVSSISGYASSAMGQLEKSFGPDIGLS